MATDGMFYLFDEDKLATMNIDIAGGNTMLFPQWLKTNPDKDLFYETILESGWKGTRWQGAVRTVAYFRRGLSHLPDFERIQPYLKGHLAERYTPIGTSESNGYTFEKYSYEDGLVFPASYDGLLTALKPELFVGWRLFLPAEIAMLIAAVDRAYADEASPYEEGWVDLKTAHET